MEVDKQSSLGMLVLPQPRLCWLFLRFSMVGIEGSQQDHGEVSFELKCLWDLSPLKAIQGKRGRAYYYPW